jgi:DNA invertase Pin-like site-specific DNA recombinase
MKSRSGRVIAYTRVSTEEQTISGLGLVDQEAVIRAEAARRGWTDLEVMSDKGFSAKNLARPAITTALGELKRGQASVLVVSKLDRLSRSLLDFATLMETARSQGWEIVVLDLAIDTSAPSGQLMASVMASFAQYERQIIGQRTSAALQVRKAQGVRLGRPRVLAAEITDRIVVLREAGKTLQAIADGLNADSIPTARGGSKWFASSVAQTLKSAALDEAARPVA